MRITPACATTSTCPSRYDSIIAFQAESMRAWKSTSGSAPGGACEIGSVRNLRRISGFSAISSSDVRPSQDPKPSSTRRGSSTSGNPCRAVSSRAKSEQRDRGELITTCHGQCSPAALRICAQPVSLNGSSVCPRYFLPPTGSPCRIRSNVVICFCDMAMRKNIQRSRTGLQCLNLHHSLHPGITRQVSLQ